MRGTVRYGSPQPVVLATSEIKQGAGTTADIVTTRPRRGARVGEGTVAMSVSGRPVFVLRGAQASHRDMRPGSRGPDVRQLEMALQRLGFSPGPVDGRYDGETAAAVAGGTRARAGSPSAPRTRSSTRFARPARTPRRRATHTFRAWSRSRRPARASRRATSRRLGSTSRPRATTSTRRSTPSPRRAAASRSRSRTSAGTTRSRPRTSRPSGRR